MARQGKDADALLTALIGAEGGGPGPGPGSGSGSGSELRGAVELTLGGNQPLVLSPPVPSAPGDAQPGEGGHGGREAFGNEVWLVRSGRIELFAVEVDAESGGELSRFHLATLPPGSLLFRVPWGRPAAGPGVGRAGEREEPEAGLLELTAVAGLDTELVGTSTARLRELARSAGHRPLVAHGVEAWIEALAGELMPTGAPRHFRPLAPGRETELTEAGEAARPEAGVTWVRHVRGSTFWLGREEVRFEPRPYLLPLPGAAWLTAAEPASLSAVAGENLLVSGALWEALERFHQLVRRLVALRLEDRDRNDRERLLGRRHLDRREMEGAHRTLASVLGSAVPGSGRGLPVIRPAPVVGPASGAPPGEGGGPRDEGAVSARRAAQLLTACRRLGERQGFELTVPPDFTAPASTDRRITRLADASRIRFRRVLLRGEWWEEDGGPLLAFRSTPPEEGKAGESAPGTRPPPEPVALLPLPKGGYELLDPANGHPGAGEPRRVDEALAAELEGRAISFYSPLPERALTLFDLVRHAFAGRGRDLGTVLAMGAAGGVLALLVPILTGQIFGNVIPAADRSLLVQMSLALAVAALAGAGFQVLRGIAVLRIGGKIDGTLQPALWDRLISLPASFFRDFTVGDLAQRAAGIDAIRETLVGHVTTSLLGAVFSLASFALLFYYSVPLALAACGLILMLGTVTLGLSYFQVRAQRRMLAAAGQVASLVLGFLHGIAKLRTGGAEARAYARWAEGFAEQRRETVRAQRLSNLQSAFNAFYAVAAMLVLFAVLGLALEEEMPVADFLAFNAAFGQFQAAVLAILGVVSSLLALIPLYERLQPILHAVPEVDPTKADVGDLRGDVEMSEACFRYTPDGPLILDRVSLRARPGEFVALVGPSGSGKSTCLRLLLGFETLGSGSIYYDGQDLGSLDLTSLRRQLGVVLQDSRLMGGDLFQNIVGSHHLGVDAAWEAAELAGVADDIREMPMGMHTVVSEGAGTFSGGQKQRVMIARAIVHRPRVLFFDEATSALDNRTQEHVARSLAGLKATRIVVAHRLSTIVGADRIYVLDKGRVVEEGSYDELLAAGGPFTRLAERQLA